MAGVDLGTAVKSAISGASTGAAIGGAAAGLAGLGSAAAAGTAAAAAGAAGAAGAGLAGIGGAGAALAGAAAESAAAVGVGAGAGAAAGSALGPVGAIVGAFVGLVTALLSGGETTPEEARALLAQLRADPAAVKAFVEHTEATEKLWPGGAVGLGPGPIWWLHVLRDKAGEDADKPDLLQHEIEEVMAGRDITKPGASIRQAAHAAAGPGERPSAAPLLFGLGLATLCVGAVVGAAIYAERTSAPRSLAPRW